MNQLKQIFIYFIIFLIIPLNLMAKSPEKIIVALNEKPSFPNRGIKGTEKSKNPGVAIETLRLIEKELKIPMVFVRLPYKRCLYDMENGKVDAVMTGSYKAKREKHGVYPKKDGKPDPDKRVYNSAYYLYVLKGSQIQWDGSNFKNLNSPVGAELGFSIIDDLKKWGVKVRTVHSAEANFTLLINKRLDSVVAHETTGQRYTHKYKNIKQLEPPLTAKPYYLLLSHQFYKAYPDISHEIWDTMSRLREETFGWKDLKEKYFSMQEWPEGGL